MTAPVLIFGKQGQIARAFAALLGQQAIALGRNECNLANAESITTALGRYKPSIIINAAAYTQVDKAETEREEAHAINAASLATIGAWAKANHALVVHFSTDYVFNGAGNTPWVETAPTHPLNHYGATKLAGEQALAASGAKGFIFRISWVYDGEGANFLNTMLRLGAERENLSIVADQFGAPCYAPWVAKTVWQVVQQADFREMDGVETYHLAPAGEVSWHGFATRIFEVARKYGVELKVKEVAAIPSSAYPTPAVRPLNSRLDCRKIVTRFGLELPSWEEGVEEALRKKLHESHNNAA